MEYSETLKGMLPDDEEQRARIVAEVLSTQAKKKASEAEDTDKSSDEELEGYFPPSTSLDGGKPSKKPKVKAKRPDRN